MKKIHCLLMVILLSAASYSISKSGKFTLINKTSGVITVQLTKIIVHDLYDIIIGPYTIKQVRIGPGEAVTTITDQCINGARLFLSGGGAFGIPFMNTENLWFRYIPKCDGTAEITKGDKRYRLKWIK